jgi:hypothetical protein
MFKVLIRQKCPALLFLAPFLHKAKVAFAVALLQKPLRNMAEYFHGIIQPTIKA